MASVSHRDGGAAANDDLAPQPAAVARYLPPGPLAITSLARCNELQPHHSSLVQHMSKELAHKPDLTTVIISLLVFSYFPPGASFPIFGVPVSGDQGDVHSLLLDNPRATPAAPLTFLEACPSLAREAAPPLLPRQPSPPSPPSPPSLPPPPPAPSPKFLPTYSRPPAAALLSGPLVPAKTHSSLGQHLGRARGEKKRGTDRTRKVGQDAAGTIRGQEIEQGAAEGASPSLSTFTKTNREACD